MYLAKPNVSFDMGSLTTKKGPNAALRLHKPSDEVDHDLLRTKSAVNLATTSEEWSCAGKGSGPKLVIRHSFTPPMGGHSVVVVHLHDDLDPDPSSHHVITTMLVDHRTIPA